MALKTLEIRMSDKYLLYIDILGFSKLVENHPTKIRQLYGIINSLNAHKHDLFKTIVFSDTVLVYNDREPESDNDHNDIVWYLIEFAEDLLFRLTGQGIFFRAVLLKGNFEHYNLKNVECFFGKSLISAYTLEKNIPAIGLFISSECNKRNKYFRTTIFKEDLHFVYLNRNLERLNHDNGGRLPVHPIVLDGLVDIVSDIRYLSDIFKHMREHPLPQVRSKYLATWDLYEQRYSGILKPLKDSDFALRVIAEYFDWEERIKIMNESIEYFAKIGEPQEQDVQEGQ